MSDEGAQAETAIDRARALERTARPDVDAIVAAWRAAIDVDPLSREPRRDLARVLRGAHRWRELVAALEQELANACLDSDDAVEVLTELEAAHERDGNPEAAIRAHVRRLHASGDPLDHLDEYRALAKATSARAVPPSIVIEVWLELSKIDPSDEEALTTLERLCERYQHWNELALVLSRRAHIADGDAKVAALRKLGTLFAEKLGDRRRAIGTWRELHDLDPGNRYAREALKKLYSAERAWNEIDALHEGKPADLARFYEMQIELESGDPATQVALLARLGRLEAGPLGHPDRARRAYERVLERDAENADANEALIPIYEAARDDERLARALERRVVATEDPELRLARLIRLAGVKEKLGDREAAFARWLEAFELDPRGEHTRVELERLAGATGRWGALVATYERAYARFPPGDDGILPLLVEAARALEAELGQPERALETFRRILAIQEENPAALQALERIYLARQRYGELLAVYARQLELARDPESRRQIVVQMVRVALEKLHDEGPAAQAVQAILATTDPDERSLLLQELERAVVAAGSWERAVAIYRKVASRPLGLTEQIELRLRLGRVYKDEVRDPERAIACFRRVLDLSPRNPQATAALAELGAADDRGGE